MLITYNSSSSVIAPQLFTNPTLSSKIIDFSFYITSSTSVISGSNTSSFINNECNCLRYNASTTLTSGILIVSDIIETSSIANYYSIYPNIATVDSIGNITYVGNGIAKFVVSKNGRMKGGQISMSINSGVTSSIFQSFTTNSLSGQISNSIVTLISGKLPTTGTYSQFSYIDDVNKQYTRNPNLWTNTIDWTCIPVLRNSTTTGRGVLVAPDILITANHVGAGNTYYFVDKNNTVISASVSASMLADTSSVANYYDLLVVRFTAPVSSSITPANVLAFSAYSSSQPVITLSRNNQTIPVIFTNQSRNMCIGMLDIPDYPNKIEVMSWKPTNSEYLKWYTPIMGGDSGNALMTVINNLPVALGCWYKADVIGGAHASCPNISAYISDINNVISKLGSSYNLTTSSLNSFTTY